MAKTAQCYEDDGVSSLHMCPASPSLTLGRAAAGKLPSR